MKDNRAWLDRAICNSRDPRLYETDWWGAGRVRKAERVERATELCFGCQVVKECAADALEPLAVSTIRAGVWIDATVLGRDRREVKAQLQAVALGMSVVSGGA